MPKTDEATTNMLTVALERLDNGRWRYTIWGATSWHPEMLLGAHEYASREAVDHDWEALSAAVVGCLLGMTDTAMFSA